VSYSGEGGNVLGVGNYCYVAVCSAALGARRPQREEGRRHIVAAALLQLVLVKSSLLAKRLGRKAPLRKPNRGKGIVSIKPRLKSV